MDAADIAQGNIDKGIEESISAARGVQPATFRERCIHCDALIPEARQAALGQTDTCVDCAELVALGGCVRGAGRVA